MKLGVKSGNKERIAKRKIFIGIGFVGLLLTTVILLAVLVSSSGAASNENASSDNAITASSADSSNSNANAVKVTAPTKNKIIKKMKEDPALRKAAAARFKAARDAVLAAGGTLAAPVLKPGEIPHYFGPWPNYANSPLPTGTINSITPNTNKNA